MFTDENLLDYIPDDLLIKTISNLSLPQILRLSSTSSRFNKACHSSLNQLRPISLYAYDSRNADECIASICDTTSQIHVDLVWNKVKNNSGIVNFLKTVWKHVYCYFSQHHDIDTIVNHLQLQHHIKLHNICLLSNKTHSNLNNIISYLSNLQWIDTQYINTKQWNLLIQNCPQLHGISFAYNTKKDIIYNDDEQFSLAPDLWSLSLHFEGDMIRTTDMQIVDNMLQSTPNLQYLQMTGSNSLYTEDKRNNIICVPPDLVALKAGFECLMGIKFDISMCSNLRFIDLELLFFTEGIDIDDHRDYHRPLTELLVSFLDVNMYKSYDKLIGVSLGYENGTPTVDKLEKLAAIDEFKAIVEESAAGVIDAYRNMDHNQLEIISTPCYTCDSEAESMIAAWCDKIFAIEKKQILNVRDTNMILCELLSEMKDDKLNRRMLGFLKQIVDFGLY